MMLRGSLVALRRQRLRPVILAPMRSRASSDFRATGGSRPGRVSPVSSRPADDPRPACTPRQRRYSSNTAATGSSHSSARSMPPDSAGASNPVEDDAGDLLAADQLRVVVTTDLGRGTGSPPDRRRALERPHLLRARPFVRVRPAGEERGRPKRARAEAGRGPGAPDVAADVRVIDGEVVHVERAPLAVGPPLTPFRIVPRRRDRSRTANHSAHRPDRRPVDRRQVALACVIHHLDRAAHRPERRRCQASGIRGRSPSRCRVSHSTNRHRGRSSSWSQSPSGFAIISASRRSGSVVVFSGSSVERRVHGARVLQGRRCRSQLSSSSTFRDHAARHGSPSANSATRRPAPPSPESASAGTVRAANSGGTPRRQQEVADRARRRSTLGPSRYVPSSRSRQSAAASRRSTSQARRTSSSVVRKLPIASRST